MLLENMTYHLREARWRAKEQARTLLASIEQRVRAHWAGADTGDDISYNIRHLTPARDQMMLRDYAPDTMLRVPASAVPRARFPVIDVHCHLNDGIVMRKWVDPIHFVRIMDATNVKVAVNLTGGWGDKLTESLRSLSGNFPGRFYVFWQIDYSHLDDPSYLIESIEQAATAGAKGVKVLKDLGLTVRDRQGKRVRIDDPRLDCVWNKAGELGMPVAIHSGDPDAFFDRMDRHNERYLELVAHPDWNYFGKGLPGKSELLEQRNRIFARHPHTRFWGLHMANHPENLDEVTEWMDDYPNLCVDLGGRIAELGRQPRRAARFINDFQDRVLFGIDTDQTVECYREYFRLLETEDDCFEYPGYPWQGAWKIYGLGLSGSVLKKLYHDNAARELGLATLDAVNTVAA